MGKKNMKRRGRGCNKAPLLTKGSEDICRICVKVRSNMDIVCLPASSTAYHSNSKKKYIYSGKRVLGHCFPPSANCEQRTLNSSGDKRRQTATEKQLTWNDTLIETSNVQASPTTRRENDLDLNLDLGLDSGIQGSEALDSNKRRWTEQSHSGCIHTSLHYKLVRLS